MTWRNDSGLVGRVVIVTGAAGGIGSAVCRALAECGAIVAGVDRPGSPLPETMSSLTGNGHVAIEHDLSRIESHSAIIAAAREAGTVVGLAHIAAVLLRNNDLYSITEEEWDLQFDVNVKSTFFLNRALAADWRAEGRGGSIVNFASQGWWTGGIGNSIPYSATKGGVVSLTRGLAKTLAADGIRVNSIAPGGVDTVMMRDGLSDAARSAFIDTVPMGRIAEPEELAGAVLYLLSDASSFVTGTVLNVSGGQLIY
ncbi:MAG: SDR family oxidoreductase [Microbacteriaceae bacterium]|nr:SDR family oxidoreductase [Microbacteriaceae bacterium]